MKKWTDAELIDAVRHSKSINDILRYIGLKINGGSHQTIKNRIKALDLDISHFTGKGWCRAEKHEEFIQKFVEYPLKDILVKNSTYLHPYGLKRKLIKAGLLENKCYKCDITTWQCKQVSLKLYHINGDRKDNRIENLTILCPNCYSQTKER